MIFLIEVIAACLLFSAIVIPSLLKNPLDWISDYPPAIQERAKELGLVSREKKLLTKAELIRKIIGIAVILLALALIMKYINGAESFLQGFLWSYALYNVVNWFDAFVIDIIWFCHSPKVRIPGTEDMEDSYHDYMFHIKASLIGMLLGLPICLLSGLIVMLLN